MEFKRRWHLISENSYKVPILLIYCLILKPRNHEKAVIITIYRIIFIE